MAVPWWGWVGFLVVVIGLIGLDLGLVSRRSHVIGFREAAIWVTIWVALALAFGVGVWLIGGPEPGLQYFTGYLIELSLSVDNMFVFVLIFSAFAVPAEYQHRVLFYGILSALVMRGVMILGGSWLITTFHWMLYLFGAFLVITGIRMALQREEREVDIENNIAMRLVSRIAPVTGEYHGQHFLARVNGQRMATPLLVVLVLIELTDLLFALDSIPAIFAITQDAFLVFTSNVMAILGLRSLYFLLAGLVERLVYLRLGLGIILAFVGVKMLLSSFVHIPTLLSLGVVILVLAITTIASLIWGKPAAQRAAAASAPSDTAHR
jgi:tellurite resistance protein TerC